LIGSFGLTEEVTGDVFGEDSHPKPWKYRMRDPVMKIAAKAVKQCLWERARGFLRHPIPGSRQTHGINDEAIISRFWEVLEDACSSQ
jgi:hypothetical protein